jgi:RNA-binding protein
MKLNPVQKKYLKSLGHSLEACVLIGKNGITKEIISEINKSLLSHELIKIKFNQGKEEKKELISEILDQTDSLHVSTSGNTALLYRMQKNTEKRKIKLPKVKS